MIRSLRLMGRMMGPVMGLVAALCAGTAAWAADTVSGRIQDGYGRLSFTTDSTITATTTGGVLAISFSAKTNIDPATIVAALPRVIASGRADADGKTLRFTLNQPVKLHVSQLGNRAVVDLADTGFTGTMPDLKPLPKPVAAPLDVASLPELKLRAGSYAKFTRLVFDWPRNVNYQVFPGAGKMTVRFSALARADVSVIARFAPAWVKNAAWRIDGSTTIFEFETDSDSGYHHFRDGTKVVLDVLAPKTDGADYVPPGNARPTVTAMPKANTPAAKPAASAAQAKAIAETAAQLAAKAPNAKPGAPAPDKPIEKADAAKPVETAQATPQAAPADAVPAADGRRTRDGARITLKGAGEKPAAVFVRGLTAWVVVENAPALDAASLKTGLGEFAGAVDALSSNGLSILRVTLKAPAEIGARIDRGNLVVEIAPKVAPPPTSIGFARNQSDPRRTSLSTLLPAADHVFPLQDPAGGDTLLVIPATPGRGVAAPRFFADFAVLPSASGLVMRAYADDLRVEVHQSRVTIARPQGLGLTPPQMPVAQSPAALAHFADGPSFLDFKNWSRPAAGSFLATQRQLTQSIAHLPAAQAGSARLNLARFYLANQFAPETLGLIDLIQKNDPALAGDAQLATMRAAASYMMGRYRDARNELAGPGFDSDRHAALWRGLIEAGQEDWKNAHGHLEQAQAVLARYPMEWQARVHLAQAEAALGMNRLDLADAALAHMPKNLPPREALAAELLKARILAASSRFHDAAPLLATLEKSGDEKIAAQAVFHRIDAGLAAGAITPVQATEQLEKLRFRWRGDALEMKTLRKLAGLYFTAGKWRDGLKTLRVATQNFPGADEARMAQDDMRGAFTRLFLKGGADKMKPVDSLALFYDNIDLTPIGPDGDDMIRRMSDRLVAVDLLGPAANLLAYQVDKRLDGIAKAQVATRLAAVYLMDRKPEKAVAALRDSHITGLPDTEMHERMLLEARAFAALKQWDNALDLIAVDEAADTRRLRADIYWESGNWAVAGQKAEELLGTRHSDAAPLTGEERGQAMRAAVAYSLAGDQPSLTRLRQNFGAKMKASPDANLFAVLSASIDQHGLAFREAAAKIASVDTLQAFMKDFARRQTDTPRS
ncbi:MAG TPA: hypothetical protein VFQ69_12230 [Rhizomicrobium sp.]|nr:hypothetical protein [Rhizomicrobium sp.]